MDMEGELERTEAEKLDISFVLRHFKDTASSFLMRAKYQNIMAFSAFLNQI